MGKKIKEEGERHGPNKVKSLKQDCCPIKIHLGCNQKTLNLRMKTPTSRNLKSHTVSFVNGLQKLLLRKIKRPCCLNVDVLLAYEGDVVVQFPESLNKLGFLALKTLLVEPDSIVVALNSLDFVISGLVAVLELLFGKLNLFAKTGDAPCE